jgi:RHS repeat-associated protein
MTFGNGLADARSYDTRYRLGTWTAGSVISKTTTWQDDDTITGITDNLNSANNRTFGYDEIHRLTTANGPWGSGSYSYDANGNRLSKTEGASSTSYTYTAGTNRLATATGSEPGTYTCDSNGNTAGDGTHTYQYSQRDRLATADSGTTASDSYDGDGRRVQKTAGGVTTLFFYDPNGKLLEEYIPATATGKDYVWLPGTYEPLARVDFGLTDTDNGDVLRCTKSSSNVHLDWSLDSTSGPFVVERSTSFTFSSPQYLGPTQSTKTFNDSVLGNGTNYAYEAFRRTLTDTLYFYHADHLGTPIAMTNGAGAIVWRAEHTPFGGIYAMPVATAENNLRFPGQYWDGETGLAQNYYRDYRHTLGRYWEPDPVALSNFLLPHPRSAALRSVGRISPCTAQLGVITPDLSSFGSRAQASGQSLSGSLYIYASNVPTMLIDPQGLFSCDYYRDRCKNTQCKYYCKFAIPFCEFFRNAPVYGLLTTECIGTCLQLYDAAKCAPKNNDCLDCGKIGQCNSNGHAACYTYCFLQYGGR